MQRRAVVLGLGAAAALGGCASAPPQTSALRAARPADLPTQVELAQVPFFPQTPLHCGPAALATVLGHLGRDAAPEQLGAEVFLPGRKGTLQTEMLAGTRRHGALAVRVPGRIEGLLREVAAGNPVVVLQNLGLAIWPRWHYAVLVGYDLSRDELLLRSGVEKHHRLGFTPFEYTWARGGNWAFVAVPPGRLPLTATEDHALQATIGFERAAPPRDAALAYQTLLDRWPDNLVAAIGLGNTRHAAGDLTGAAVAFEAAARQHQSAAAWLNLGEVALELGQRERAALAATEALKIDGPWAEQARLFAARVNR